MNATANSNPKINIAYNRFLDPICIFYCQNNPELKARGWNDWKPPEKDVVKERVTAYKKAWGAVEKTVLEEMCDFTGLQFRRNIIDVHIVSGLARGFSNPIVLKSGYSPDDFVGTLVHELAHVLAQDNIDIFPPSILAEMFPGEEPSTTRHIFVYTIWKHIFLDILHDETLLAKQIARIADDKLPHYATAWNIVEKIGHDKIMSDIREKYIDSHI